MTTTIVHALSLQFVPLPIVCCSIDLHISTASSSRSRPNAKEGSESLLPDEIITDILRRLQVKDVLRCRCVVKRWRDLTSTQHFVDLHKEQGMTRMILVDTGKRKHKRDQFFLDKWWIPARKKPTINRMHSYPLYHTEFSQDGLLALRSRCLHEWLIVNPTNCEKVRIIISLEHALKEVCGIYFNPTLKEYCTLLRPRGPRPIAYQILNLGPKPRLRDISNPYKDRTQYSNFGWRHSILVDEFLYWMVDPLKPDELWGHGDIIEFDIGSEEFKLMRYPAQRTVKYGLCINLLNVDGVLTLVQFSRGEGHADVNIWTLKDRASESWTGSHYCVSLVVYPPSPRNVGWGPVAIGVKFGEIVIKSNNTLFVCNLKQGTTRIFGRKKYSDNSFLYSHGLCLSSLKNCKPVIRIGTRMKKCQDCDSLDKEDTSKLK